MRDRSLRFPSIGSHKEEGDGPSPEGGTYFCSQLSFLRISYIVEVCDEHFAQHEQNDDEDEAEAEWNLGFRV